jgi:putative addiction module component (TIGR02574 family)
LGFPREHQGMIAEKIPALLALSMDEKLILAGELWDELAAHPEAFPHRGDHVKVLQERLEHYRQHPEDITAWEDVKARILASR